MDLLKNLIFSTPLLKVLDLFLQNPSSELTDADLLQKVTNVKRSAVHLATVRLYEMGIIERERKGKKYVNRLRNNHPWLSPIMIASNLLEISPLIEQLKEISSKVILFGSRANASHKADSDYDLYVISEDQSAVRRVVKDSDLAEHLQVIIKNAEGALELAEKEPVLSEHIKKGVVLWDR